MSITGYLILCRIALAGGILGAVSAVVLYRRLEIRKACSMLYGMPLRKKPAKMALASSKLPPTQQLAAPYSEPTDVLERQDTVCLYRQKPEMKYEQTYIHTDMVIED